MKLLIPLAYLNEACNLSLNTDEKEYKIWLKRAQEELESCLGAEFYAEIDGQYNINPDLNSFTAANATLYEDYIKDFLAWSTCLFYIRFSQSQATPTGFREFNDENSNILADVKIVSREKNTLDQANHYKYRLQNYLKNEQTKVSTAFPLYHFCGEEEFSFGISSITRDSYKDSIITVNQAVRSNE